jgi:hypothetical protein
MEGGGARPSWGVMTLQKRHATRHRRMSLRCRTYNARGTMLVLCPGGFFDEAYGGAASATSPYPRIEIRAAVTVIPKIRAACGKPRRMNAHMMVTPSCKLPLPQHFKHKMGQSRPRAPRLQPFWVSATRDGRSPHGEGSTPALAEVKPLKIC